MTGREVGTGSTATGSPVTAETCSLRDLSNRVLTEYSATTGASGTRRWKKDYLYRNSTLLAVESTEAGSRSLQHFTVDHLGTPSLVMDRTGAVLETHHYWAYGEEMGTPAGTEKMRFTGHERDLRAAGSADDLDYMHARYFGPLMGRFLGVDPVSGSLRHPQTWNQYQYVRGNVMNLTDPTGLYETDVHRDLTTVLAEAAGFSKDQAQTIGAADQGVDDNPATGPFASEEARADYHFTTEQRRGELWNAFDTTKSLAALGTFLHADQDSFSHDGFGPKTGHLSAGHAPDKTHNDPGKAYVMASTTYRRLTAAADKLGIPLSNRAAWKEINKLVDAFNRAATPAEKKKKAFEAIQSKVRGTAK